MNSNKSKRTCEWAPQAHKQNICVYLRLFADSRFYFLAAHQFIVNRHCSLSYLSIAKDDELLRSQTFQSYRAARVQFVGADTDFGAEAVFKTIGKAR